MITPIKPTDLAFPRAYEAGLAEQLGMSIRVWLTGQALAGLCAYGGSAVGKRAVEAADEAIAALNRAPAQAAPERAPWKEGVTP